MRGIDKLTDELKLKLYPAIIGLLGACLAASLLSHFEVQVWTSAPPPVPMTERSPIESTESAASVPSPSSPPEPLSSPSAPPIASAAPPPGTQGSLRISNPTLYPVRVVLSKQTGSTSAAYEQPVHWDFAPSEGEAKGLKVSLPDGTLQIRTGDVLAAFAQDGSRRYWGPYVVGQTQLPAWNSTTQEWQLNLQP